MKWMEPRCSAVAYLIRAALYSFGTPWARKVSVSRASFEQREENEPAAVRAAGNGVALPCSISGVDEDEVRREARQKDSEGLWGYSTCPVLGGGQGGREESASAN
jgi:hypothetical protein